MKLSGNTILITGGATGIGLGLAIEFLNAGNEVIICSRRQNRLDQVKNNYPDIHTKVCDINNETQAKELYKWAIATFPNLNILINNAGIQRNINFISNTDALFHQENEIQTNLISPIKLAAIFIPHLAKQKQAAIMNVTSGLGFIPLSIMPVYCATKAALHSFSLSLRHQLKNTCIKVFELIPPMVDTELGGSGRDDRQVTYRGISPKEYAVETLKGIDKDEYEIPVGSALSLVSPLTPEQIQSFNRMNR